ncbi:hypothetical protein HY479_00025 [Candidatus Uhrbacteria bacterium]|nr:hypothetical protein [Candidatus Uhrbacteria bacterium]
MSNRTVLSGAFVAFIISFAPFAVQVSLAAACNVGPYKGECRPNGCEADEMASTPAKLSPKNYQDVSNCNGECCIKKGDSLCALVAGEEGAPVGTWGCSPQCTGTPLTQVAGGFGETCAGSNVCCSVVQSPVKEAATGTKPGGGAKGSPITLQNPLGSGTTFFTIIQRVISAFLGLVGALALGVFIYAGVLWMTAGSSDRVQKAKDALKYAVIGLFMIAFAYTISAYFFDVLAGAAKPKEEKKPEIATPPDPNK